MKDLDYLIGTDALRDDGPYGGGYLLIAIPLKAEGNTSPECRFRRTLEDSVGASGMMGQKRWMVQASSVALVKADGVEWVKRISTPLRTREQVEGAGYGIPFFGARSEEGSAVAVEFPGVLLVEWGRGEKASIFASKEDAARAMLDRPTWERNHVETTGKDLQVMQAALMWPKEIATWSEAATAVFEETRTKMKEASR